MDENMNEKDKLYRTIRKLLIIGAISIAAIFVLSIIAYIVMLIVMVHR